MNSDEIHWKVLQEWKDENVKWQAEHMRDIGGYSFNKIEDEHGFLRDQVLACKKYLQNNKRINDNPNRSDSGVDFNLLAHYEVNQLTGEKFLRLMMRQWITSYDPSDQTKQHRHR